MSVIDVTRAEWRARPPRCRTHSPWPAGVDLWVHHTAGRIPAPNTADESEVQRETQNFHLDVRRWCDYAYNYGIGPSGTIYEGRGFEVHGAHSPGRNHEPAVVLMGTYATVVPTAAQHRAVWELLRDIDAGELRGHRENSPTTCPGDAAMRTIVDAPAPGLVTAPRPIYYLEELPFTEGAGHGPQVVGQSWGYATRAMREVKLASFKAVHPRTPVSTHRGILGQGRLEVPAANEADIYRYFIYAWGPGMHGLDFRFGPWRSKEGRDQVALRRARNRLMQPIPPGEDAQREFLARAGLRCFNGRQRSRYPWPS